MFYARGGKVRFLVRSVCPDTYSMLTFVCELSQFSAFFGIFNLEGALSGHNLLSTQFQNQSSTNVSSFDSL